MLFSFSPGHDHHQELCAVLLHQNYFRVVDGCAANRSRPMTEQSFGCFAIDLGQTHEPDAVPFHQNSQIQTSFLQSLVLRLFYRDAPLS